MLLLLLVLCYWTLVAATTSYTLADIQYSAPRCTIDNWTLWNRMGALRISNSLLDGDQLQLDVQLRLAGSCKLCQLQQQQYCGGGDSNATLSNASSSSGNLHLAYDTSYNLQAVNIDGASSPRVGTWLLSEDGRATTPLLVGGDACGRTLQLVVVALVSIERPIARDLMLIATPLDATGVDIATAPCVASSSGRTVPLDCRIAASFYTISYPVSNCLGTTDSGATDGGGVETNSPFYYYYQIWRGDYGVPWDRAAHATLCGEQWASIFLRTQLHLYCNPDVPLHVALKPWYEAALVAITAWLDRRYDEPALWLALSTLERTCAQRDATGQSALNDTIFYDMVQALRDASTGVSDEEACAWMARDAPELATATGNITLPFYVTHFRAWYFALFKYITPPDATMPRQVIVLILIPLLVVSIVGISAIFTVYHVFFRPSEFTLNRQSYRIIT